MKMFVAALLAFSDLVDAEDSSRNTFSECIPALIPAESMQEAAETALAALKERWKPEEGWHTHQANIMPVTKAFYDTYELYSGILDMTDEPGQTFNF